jgi:histidinol-phosphate aminotransferase
MTNPHIRPDVLSMPDVAYGLVDLADVAARHGIPVERIVKLDANENVYGPSPKTLAALASPEAWQFYPDISYRALHEGLAAYTGASAAQIVAGNGCDEIIQLIVQVFLRPGEQAIDNAPSFSVYDWAVRIQGAQTVVVPRLRTAGYALDVDGVLRAITPTTRLVFICNPNNPTGGLTPPADIEMILDSGVIVALDETYYEFCGVTHLPLQQKYPNLIIMRSFSKWAALAGLRVGYGVFHPDLARQVHKIRMPFNVNRAGYVAAVASLADKDYLWANVAKIVAERDRLFALLQAIPFLSCYPSHGNYILCDVIGGSALALRDEVEREGVLLRSYVGKLLPNAVRVSVGKPEHSDAAIAALLNAGRRLKLR